MGWAKRRVSIPSGKREQIDDNVVAENLGTSTPMRIHKNGVQIESLDTWAAHAGPKSPDQWVEGRSAMELARAWLNVGEARLPTDVSSLLEGHPAFGSVSWWDAEPEVKLPFDTFPGEPRNSDLVVHARDRYGAYIIGVEAKADEPFSDTVKDILSAALERKIQSTSSNGIARVENLARCLFDQRTSGKEARVGDLRYQLLTAAAGVLCEAERKACSRALLLVHEFVTSRTQDELHKRNADDLRDFVRRLSRGTITDVKSGEIFGPFMVPGVPLFSAKVDFYVGKVSTNLRNRTSHGRNVG